jgi:anti-anti-sigma factor
VSTPHLRSLAAWGVRLTQADVDAELGHGRADAETWPALQAQVAHHGEVTVVALSGSLDAHTGQAFTEVLLEQLATGRVRLVADLSAVGHASSAGLRALLAMLQETRRRGGDLRLASPRHAVARALALSGFTSLLHVFAGLTAALASWPQGRGP